MSFWRQKVAIITGASSGLGLQLARAMVRDAARLILVARNEPRLTAAAKYLHDQGARQEDLLTISADITQSTDVERLFKAASDRFERLDLLINCAGKSMRGLASQTAPEDFRELFELNAMAAIRCCQRRFRR